MRFFCFLLLWCAVLVSGCGNDSIPDSKDVLPPFVKSAELRKTPAAALKLSGTVHARVETPLAFQVEGRIASRFVDAGEKVHAGQTLFQLDARDLEQALMAAQAASAAAQAALASAKSDLARSHQLRQEYVISAQALERAELVWRESKAGQDGAAARQVQARNALEYARLQSPMSGVLIDVAGEQGQVMMAGQPVAILAQDGARDVEVYFPDYVTPPAMGEVLLYSGNIVPIKLRETAGAVEARGRTLRARYALEKPADELMLGAIVQARFRGATSPQATYSVPIGAIDERGKGARVWRVTKGKLESVDVSLLTLDSEQVQIQGALAEGDHIVVLGAHLLNDGMAVRELAR